MTTTTVQMPVAFRELANPNWRTQIWHGGRGGAKSWSIATELVAKATRKRMRILACREIQKSIDKSSKRVIENMIRRMGLASDQGGPWVIRRATIENSWNGSEFLFEGLRTNIDSIRSIEGLDLAWIEEASNTSSTSWRVLSPTVRKRGSQIWASLNRKEKTDFLDMEYIQNDHLPPRTLVRKVSWRDNPDFPDVLREEMEYLKVRDYDRYLHVWEGEPVRRSDACVFKRNHQEDIDKDIPETLKARYGADWGMTNPTVLAKVYVWHEERIIYIARTAYKIGATVDETPALFAGDAPRDFQNVPRWENRYNHPGIEGAYAGPIRADSSAPQLIRYLRDRGFNITHAVKGPRSVEEGVDFLRTYDIYIHPDCAEAWYEFQTYSYKVDKDNEDIILPELEDKDNHVIDSVRYAVEEDRRGGGGRAIILPRPPVIVSSGGPLGGHYGASVS